jgi:hypothetical protein
VYIQTYKVGVPKHQPLMQYPAMFVLTPSIPVTVTQEKKIVVRRCTGDELRPKYLFKNFE